MDGVNRLVDIGSELSELRLEIWCTPLVVDLVFSGAVVSRWPANAGIARRWRGMFTIWLCRKLGIGIVLDEWFEEVVWLLVLGVRDGSL